VVAEKHPLSYQCHNLSTGLKCGVQTLPLEMHYRGEKLGENKGRSGQISDP